MKTEFSRHIFEKKKNPNYQVSSKSVQEEPGCSMRTGRHDEANSRFSRFYERD